MARRPKLNLERGQTYTIELVYDEPKEGETRGKPWWMYSGMYEGEEVMFFAPNERVHEEIQATGARKGDTLTIGVDERGNWHVERNGGSVERAAAPARASVQRGSERTWDSLTSDLRECIAEATQICEDELPGYTAEDVRSIAATLYIQAIREDVDIPKS